MSGQVLITFRSEQPTYERDFGRDLLEAMIGVDPRLTPQFFDDALSEVQTPYVDLEASLAQWGNESTIRGYTQDVSARWGAKWRRRSPPRYKAEITHMHLDNYGGVVPSSFALASKWEPTIDWGRLFLMLCSVTKAQLAMLHLFTPAEELNPNEDFAIGHLGTLWNPCFSGVSWAMMLGTSLAKRADVSKLETLGFPVCAADSGVLVSVTEALSDVAERYDYFNERRRVLKEALPGSIFG